MPLELEIRRDGSLGSVTRQVITEAQANSIIAIAKADWLTYRDVLEFIIHHPSNPRFFAGDVGFTGTDEDFTGAGDSVEAFRG